MPTSSEFELILERLRDTSGPVSTASLYHLSDLSQADLAAFEDVWTELPADRRLAILQELSEIAEANFEVNFEQVFRLGLEDSAAEARATAIRALWEAEDPTLIAPLIDFMTSDPDAHVRGAAASALGRYVYLGEIEELSPAQAQRVEDALLEVVRGPGEVEVRQRALEAVAYASRAEIGPLIREAYASPDPLWRATAVFAMGRTADAGWAPQVRAELESIAPEMRFEAARAAGELELTDSAPELAHLTEDVDVQVQEAAIWSLGQIGGDFARDTLNQLLAQTTGEDEQDYIQEALDNLAFTDEVNAFSIFDLDAEGDDAPDDEVEGDED